MQYSSLLAAIGGYGFVGLSALCVLESHDALLFPPACQGTGGHPQGRSLADKGEGALEALHTHSPGRFAHVGAVEGRAAAPHTSTAKAPEGRGGARGERNINGCLGVAFDANVFAPNAYPQKVRGVVGSVGAEVGRQPETGSNKVGVRRVGREHCPRNSFARQKCLQKGTVEERREKGIAINLRSHVRGEGKGGGGG